MALVELPKPSQGPVALHSTAGPDPEGAHLQLFTGDCDGSEVSVRKRTRTLGSGVLTCRAHFISGEPVLPCVLLAAPPPSCSPCVASPLHQSPPSSRVWCFFCGSMGTPFDDEDAVAPLGLPIHGWGSVSFWCSIRNHNPPSSRRRVATGRTRMCAKAGYILDSLSRP